MVTWSYTTNTDGEMGWERYHNKYSFISNALCRLTHTVSSILFIGTICPWLNWILPSRMTHTFLSKIFPHRHNLPILPNCLNKSLLHKLKARKHKSSARNQQEWQWVRCPFDLSNPLTFFFCRLYGQHHTFRPLVSTDKSQNYYNVLTD